MILLDHGSVIAELKSDIAIWAVVWWGAEIPSVFRGRKRPGCPAARRREQPAAVGGLVHRRDEQKKLERQLASSHPGACALQGFGLMGTQHFRILAGAPMHRPSECLLALRSFPVGGV